MGQDKLCACQEYEVSTSKSRLILTDPLSFSINTKEILQSESFFLELFCTLLRMTYLFLTYITGYHYLQKTLILLALKLIMAQSTDPPDIEQSQKYRVPKKYFFCVKMANVVLPNVVGSLIQHFI